MKQGTATRAFQGRVDPEYDGEPMEEAITGFVFSRQDLFIKMRTTPVHEIMDATKLKTFVVYFVFSANSKEGVEQVARSVQSFRQASHAATKP